MTREENLALKKGDFVYKAEVFDGDEVPRLVIQKWEIVQLGAQRVKLVRDRLGSRETISRMKLDEYSLDEERAMNRLVINADNAVASARSTLELRKTQFETANHLTAAYRREKKART